MNYDWQQELASKTQWSGADVEQLALIRPRFSMWAFAPNSVFEDGALSPLEGMTQLRSLSFRDSTLTRDNLLVLTRLPTLYRLDLHGCRFTPNDFALFCQALAAGSSPKLSELWLENTLIGDDDLLPLGKIEQLRWLILSGTKITDSGMEHLQLLQKLETLWLDRTHLSNDGVLQLAVLPRLTGMPTRETACSPDIQDQLFRAQVALQKSNKSVDAGQAAAADQRLRDFLREREDWERAAYQRANAIEKQFRPQRPQSNVYSEAEGIASGEFWRELNVQKSALAERFCTQKLLARGAGCAGSYGNPPEYEAFKGDWIATETPSKTKTVFTGEGGITRGKRRYTMKWENEEWRLDEVQWWSGGWKRDHV